MTTVPAASFCLDGTHSATSWYLASMFPLTVRLPEVSMMTRSVVVPASKALSEPSPLTYHPHCLLAVVFLIASIGLER